MDAMVSTRVPSPELAPLVEILWHCDASPAARHPERVLPNGRFQIVIDVATGAGSVSGLRSRSVTIGTAAVRSLTGAVFRPGGARGFIGVAAHELFNGHAPLDALWGSRSRTLGDRLGEAATASDRLAVLESALLEALRTTDRDRLAMHPSVAHALHHFRRNARMHSVEEVSRDAGLSRRRFGQLFDEQIGMTPKLYCRLIRFRRVLRQIAAGEPVDWADVAAAGGYYDQAHLAHEFRDFSGMSPGSFLKADRPFENHVRVTSHSYKTGQPAAADAGRREGL